MPIDPVLAGGIHPTVEAQSPLQTVGALMQLRGQMSDIALHNQQIEASKQQQADIAEQAAQRARVNQSTQKLQGLLQDSTVHDAIGKGDFSPIWKAGITPDVAAPFIKNIQDMQETAQKLQKGKADFYASGRSEFGKGLEGILSEKDDAIAADQYNGLRNTLGAEHPELAQQLPQLMAGPNFRQNLKDLAATNGVARAILENQKKLEGDQAKIDEANALAGKNTAEADRIKFELDLIKGASNGTQDAEIEKRFTGHPETAQAAKDAFRQTLHATGDLKAAGAEVNKIYENEIGAASKIKSETTAKVAEQAAMLPGEVKKAVAVENATAPAKVAEQVAAARALRAGDNAAVAGVAPGAVSQVQEHAIKLDQDYATAKEATDAMDRLISLATNGNKAAGANAALAGVGAVNAINGIKRINSAEIAQYGTAGSLLDEIKGKLGKWTEGKPIPAGVLKDIKELHDQLGTQAYQKYTGALDSLNKRTGATYQPTYAAPGGAVLPRGNGAAIDKATARKFYEAAGGDPAKAQKLAEDNGWKVE